MRALVARLILILTLTACGSPVTSPSPSQAISETPSPETSAPQATPASTPLTKTCRPTDQDRDVYHPARLHVVASSLRVSPDPPKFPVTGSLEVRNCRRSG